MVAARSQRTRRCALRAWATGRLAISSRCQLRSEDVVALASTARDRAFGEGSVHNPAVRRFLSALAFTVAVVVAIGPAFWVVGTISGSEMHIDGGWVRLGVDVAVVGVLLAVGVRLAAAAPTHDELRRSAGRSGS